MGRLGVDGLLSTGGQWIAVTVPVNQPVHIPWGLLPQLCAKCCYVESAQWQTVCMGWDLSYARGAGSVQVVCRTVHSIHGEGAQHLAFHAFHTHCCVHCFFCLRAWC